ncbi:hypothetical protein BURK1_02179 [Burkholderiales bacterium]|nr:hypothetical protein BURK1_02179 [Burkholderiales bacterium]
MRSTVRGEQPAPAGGSISELRTAGGYLRGLGAFLTRPQDFEEGRGRLERQMARRQRTFADVLQRAVFENPGSPYRRLFAWARITQADVARLLAETGVEGTLERLHDAGVHVHLDEFKGRRPIVRPGLDLEVRAEDFDNPLTTRQYEARTGGSSGAARRILVDLGLLEHESAYHASFLAATGTGDRALAIWHPAPPGAVGIKTALIRSKLARPAEKWFSQTPLNAGSLKHAAFTRATVLTARLCGAPVPMPEYTPAQDVGRVVAWLARKCAQGEPAILVTTASAGVRTCTAAIDAGVDIRDTLFILGGEPFTPAKAELIARTGSRAASHYAMVEAGAIGVACQAATHPDDVHLLGDKVATIRRDLVVGDSGRPLPALFHTTLLHASPKVMLNVESGDYGVLEDRDCGCRALPPPFRRHLHTIRSYEKLTSEGMSFLGGDLLTLVEQVLPARFGGYPTYYQFVEREQAGLPKVSLVVSRAVGKLDAALVVETVLDFLRRRGLAAAMIASMWTQGRTLEVLRGDSHVTSGGKIQPLQVVE